MCGIAGMFGGSKKKKTVTVAEALPILEDEELEKLIDPEKAAQEAKRRVQEIGIIFADQIWSADFIGTKAQVADRCGSGFLGVILKIALGIIFSFNTNDLNGVFIRADSTI